MNTGDSTSLTAGISIFSEPLGTDDAVLPQPIVISVPPNAGYTMAHHDQETDVICFNGKNVVAVRRKAVERGNVTIEGVTAPA